jgi:hypothetical protein
MRIARPRWNSLREYDATPMRNPAAVEVPSLAAEPMAELAAASAPTLENICRRVILALS